MENSLALTKFVHLFTETNKLSSSWWLLRTDQVLRTFFNHTGLYGTETETERGTADLTALTSTGRANSRSGKSQPCPERERGPRARLSVSFPWTWTPWYLKDVSAQKTRISHDFLFLCASHTWTVPALMGLGIQVYGTGQSQAHAYCWGQEWSYSKMVTADSFPPMFLIFCASSYRAFLYSTQGVSSLRLCSNSI